MTFKPLAMGFHAHTDLGSLDGGSTVLDKVKRAKDLGRIADVVTDHGTMSALASHHSACKKCGIKSIHGIEAYIIDPFEPTKKNRHGNDEFQYVHLTIHFKTQNAFKYFSSLTPLMESRAIVKMGERKPLLYLEELEPIANEITVGSGCLVGIVQKYILNKQYDKAIKSYERLRSMVPKGSFFVEVFPHIIDRDWVRPEVDRATHKILKPGYYKINECGSDGMPLDIQKAANKFVIEMARKYGDPIVISEDSHVATPEDKIVQDIRIGNGLGFWKFTNSYHMADTNDWAKNLKTQLGVSDKDIEEWVDNSYLFVDQFKDYTFRTAKDGWLLPKFEDIYEVKEGETTKKKLKELIRKYGRFPSQDHPRFKEYAERLKSEVDVLADNGVADFLSYFFVLEDIGEFCRKEGILFNTRGSGGGSLVLYLIGCSITDPLKYDLPFERFLTLGRIKAGTLPDVDLDFSDRDRVIAYLQKKYGNKVLPISINKPLKVKGSIRDIDRVMHGEVRPEVDELCKMMPGIPQGVDEVDWLMGYEDPTTGAHVKGFIEDIDHPGCMKLLEYRKKNPELWEILLRCLGVTRERAPHACGILIAPEAVGNFMPALQIGDKLCTAYPPKDVEAVGGVKFDILGVTTLTALAITMKSIKERTGLTLEWKEFDHDPSVYSDIIAKDQLAAIFQINTRTVAPFVKKTSPKSVAGISNLIALVRPGCLDADSPDPKDPKKGKAGAKTAADYYIECSQGTRKPYYIHPDLEPILSDSYGVCLFQEQPLRIFRDLGEMSFEQAEVARRAIGKKDKNILDAELSKLNVPLAKRGWSSEQIEAIKSMIAASARYSFNRAHSASYGIVGYNGAWLKKHYPLDFWKGELTAHAGEVNKIKHYMEEAAKYILPVDAAYSHPTEWKIEGDMLRPPLVTLKGVGDKAAQELNRFINLDLATLELKQKPLKASKVKNIDMEPPLYDTGDEVGV